MFSKKIFDHYEFTDTKNYRKKNTKICYDTIYSVARTINLKIIEWIFDSIRVWKQIYVKAILIQKKETSWHESLMLFSNQKKP
jgi:hypothetical protein